MSTVVASSGLPASRPPLSFNAGPGESEKVSGPLKIREELQYFEEVGPRTEYGQRRLKCRLCGAQFMATSTRARSHLAGTRKGVGACPKVPLEVKRRFAEASTAHRPAGKEDNAASVRRAPPAPPAPGTATATVAPTVLTSRMATAKGQFFPGLEQHHHLARKQLSAPPDESSLAASKRAADVAIARFFFANNIDSDVVTTKGWQELVRRVSDCGPGYSAPRAEELRPLLAGWLQSVSEF
eukprot:jgi/Tetstr1/436713/TSEL_025496.t1